MAENGVRGERRELGDHIHVPCVQHHSSVPVSWARATRLFARRMKFFQNLQLFAIVKPLKSLNCDGFHCAPPRLMPPVGLLATIRPHRDVVPEAPPPPPCACTALSKPRGGR